MSDKTNIERLEEAGVLDASNMTDEHKAIVNNEMSDEEIHGLMAAHRSISRLNSSAWTPDEDGGMF